MSGELGVWMLAATPAGLPRATLSSAVEGNLMIITTTSVLPDMRVDRYLGIVTGEAILGANVFKDFFAGIRDIVGGRSGAYERELAKAREIALEEMERNAVQQGANAIVGVDIDYETISTGNGSMLMVSTSGTAVLVS